MLLSSYTGILGNQPCVDTGGDIQTLTPAMFFLLTHLRSSLLPISHFTPLIALRYFLATRRSVGSSFSISQVKQEGNILYTRRLVLKTNSLPSWGKHFFSDAKVAVIEECMVDRTKPSLIWYTRWSIYTYGFMC